MTPTAYPAAEAPYDFIRLKDVPRALKAIHPVGVRWSNPRSDGFPEERIIEMGHHIQGIARYGPYTIASDAAAGESGILAIFSDEKLLYALDTPEGTGHHPGGIAVAGDILGVPFDHTRTYAFYDLSPLRAGAEPQLITVTDEIYDFGTAALGLTFLTYQGEEVLLLTDQKKNFAILRLPLTAESKLERLQVEDNAVYAAYDDPDGTGWCVSETVALLTDTQNTAWLLGFSCRAGLRAKFVEKLGQPGLDNEDAVVLHKIEVTEGRATVTGPYYEREFQPFNACLLGLGNHFRLGGGVQVLDAEHFAILSTGGYPGNIALQYAHRDLKAAADKAIPRRYAVNAFLPQSAGLPAQAANLAYRGLRRALQGVFRFV
ncbi:MAG: hypothetical protein LBR73_02600 [Oscillospiraceae bacterium]|jgi:hypothetical protein|nr:hypothetical protein [Oscillospiraceae bacterium]